MKIVKKLTADDVATTRRNAYLAAWPMHRQLEAHAEAAAGRPEKLDRMLAELQAIKAANPLP